MFQGTNAHKSYDTKNGSLRSDEMRTFTCSLQAKGCARPVGDGQGTKRADKPSLPIGFF